MSEKLTPLEAFENIIIDLAPHLINANVEEIKIVKTELNELEEYKSILKDFGLENPQNLIDNLNIIKDSKFHEKLKALEIIKEKGNFLCLDYSEYENKYYIYDAELYMHNELTKEEYELLKEVLEWKTEKEC